VRQQLRGGASEDEGRQDQSAEQRDDKGHEPEKDFRSCAKNQVTYLGKSFLHQVRGGSAAVQFFLHLYRDNPFSPVEEQVTFPREFQQTPVYAVR
jgi:hypothetical protein